MKLGVLVYVRTEGKTLMLYRNKKENDMHEGKWNGLGGKIEAGESPEDALHREVMEESGLVIKSPQLRGILTFPNFKNTEDWYVYLYTVKEYKGELIDSPEGELHWIDDDKIPELNLWQGDYLFFDWLKQDKFFSAKLVYEDEELVNHDIHYYLKN